MLRLFRLRSAAECPTCFFCSTPVSNLQPPANAHNFQCEACGCWNHYDANGRIRSDEPAMHDEQLNTRSFSLKASPSRNTIPALQNNNPLFCHTCRTNQTLQMNLLANYLPAPSDPQYQTLLEQLPVYKQSLDARYPTVCEDCQQAVQSEIDRKDQMARTNALGGWLNETKRKTELVRQRPGVDAHKKLEVKPSGSGRATSWPWKWLLGPGVQDVTIRKTVPLWRIEGFLWVATLCASLFWSIATLTRHPSPSMSNSSARITLPIVLVSKVWSEWDPTFSRMRLGKAQGRDLVVEGRSSWTGHQQKAWALRVFAASIVVWNGGILIKPVAWILLAGQIVLFLLSVISLRIVERPKPQTSFSRAGSLQPPSQQTRSRSQPLRVPSSSLPHKPVTRAASEADFFSTLSLSGHPLDTSSRPAVSNDRLESRGPTTIKPTTHIQHPVFGQTSLSSYNNPAEDAEMDWDPSPDYATLPPAGLGNPLKKVGSAYRPMESENWIKPPKFFAKEQPTGLEGLFDKTSWFGPDPDESAKTPLPSSTSSTSSHVLGLNGNVRSVRVVGFLSAGLLGIGLAVMSRSFWEGWL